LAVVVDRFFFWLLVDSTYGVVRFAKGDAVAAIEAVAALLARRIDGHAVTVDELENAQKTAYAAYAAAAAAARTARQGAYDRMVEKLLELMAAAPVVEVVG